MTEIEANDLLNFLPVKERSAIKDRYWHKKGLHAVGLALGVSRERARQLIVKGQKRLKKLMVGENVHLTHRIKTQRIKRANKEAKPRQMSERLDFECRAWLNGEIKTQTEIAHKYGVTRACISRRVCQIRGKSGLPPSKRQILARKTYGLRQMIVAQTRKPTCMTDIQKETEALWRIDYD